MKKLERLRWIEATYGSEYVSPYKECHTWDEIHKAMLQMFDQADNRWPSLRTDFPDGLQQGFNLPFLMNPTFDQVKEVWDKHREDLVYIICRSVQPILCCGVAQRISDEHIVVEINDQEPMIAQRAMYRKPENLTCLFLGPGSGVEWQGQMRRVHNPEDAGYLALDKIYSALFAGGAEELTFTVMARPYKKIVIW